MNKHRGKSAAIADDRRITVQGLENLYDYSYWANRKIFEVITRLAPGQFTQTTAGSYGSVRNTLVHVMSAEAGWLERCGGPPRGPRLNPADFPTPQSVIVVWATIEAKLRAFISLLKGEDLECQVKFSLEPQTPYSAQLGELMQHAALHAVHHRGQISLLLRMLGHVPGNFDILLYYLEEREVARTF